MKEYRVSWAIEVDGVDAADAAWNALDLMLAPGSTATVFQVRERGKRKTETIDLSGRERPE